MKRHLQAAMTSLVILAAGPLWAVSAQGADSEGESVIAYPEALRDAGVAVSRMTDGQSESLIVGNGDLYGIVREKGGAHGLGSACGGLPRNSPCPTGHLWERESAKPRADHFLIGATDDTRGYRLGSLYVNHYSGSSVPWFKIAHTACN